MLRVEGPDGDVRRIEARAVIDASGTWGSPNPMGADGLPAIGECEVSDRIATGLPDVLGKERARYADRTTTVIGSGHSALNALIELAALRKDALGTKIIWLMRKEPVEAAFGGETADALPERGALGSQARYLVETGAVQVVTPFRSRKSPAMRIVFASRASMRASQHRSSRMRLSSSQDFGPIFPCCAKYGSRLIRGLKVPAASVRLSIPICTAAARCARTARVNWLMPSLISLSSA